MTFDNACSGAITLVLWDTGVAAILALVIAIAGRFGPLRRRPVLRQWVWLIVLVKLVTPPLIHLPVIPSGTMKTLVAEALVRDGMDYKAAYRISTQMQQNNWTFSSFGDEGVTRDVRETISRRSRTEARAAAILVATSLLGSIVLLLRGLLQIRRFSALLKRADWSHAHGHAVVEREAAAMGVRAPALCVVNTPISPLLWMQMRRPVIVLPVSLLKQCSDAQIALVVRHELAHYLHRHHWISGVVFLVGLLLWWNPVAWWARRELKAAQEAACDALVLAEDDVSRRGYAETLLLAIESLEHGFCIPRLAVGFGDNSAVTRRFELIADERVSGRLTWAALFVAIGIAVVTSCHPAIGP